MPIDVVHERNQWTMPHPPFLGRGALSGGVAAVSSSARIGDCWLHCQAPSPVRDGIGSETERQRGRFVDYSPGATILGLSHGKQFPVADLIEGGPQ